MMYDHKMAKEMANITKLVEEIEVLNIRIDKLEEKLSGGSEANKQQLTLGKNGVMI